MPHTSIQVRVPFSDVDSTGRIHFTAMFRYMEIAEHELVRTSGFPRTTTFPELSFPRVHVACDYLKAIGYDDILAIDTHIERVGRSSWNVAFTARIIQHAEQLLAENDEIAARGEMTIVTLDRKTERAVPIPAELRAALSAA